MTSISSRVLSAILVTPDGPDPAGPMTNESALYACRISRGESPVEARGSNKALADQARGTSLVFSGSRLSVMERLTRADARALYHRADGIPNDVQWLAHAAYEAAADTIDSEAIEAGLLDHLEA
jgi:hypothetical protein